MKKVRLGAAFLAFAALGTVLFSMTASAYIDPSAVTYIVQVVVGIVIAGAAAFGFYYKKIKRKVTKSMKKTDEAYEDDIPVAQADDEDDDEFDDSDIPDRRAKG